MARFGKKGLFVGLEEHEEQEDTSVEQDMLEQQVNDKEMDEFAETAQDADDALEVGEIMSDETRSDEEKTEAVLEHFMNKMGLGPKHSFESLASDRVKDKLLKVQCLALEGFFGRYVSNWKARFVTEEKLKIELGKLKTKIKPELRKEKTISEPGWGRTFAFSGNETITAGEVETIILDHVNVLTNPDYGSAIDECVQIMDKLSIQLSKSGWIANSKYVEEIGQMSDTVNQLVSKINDRVKLPKLIKHDPDYQPLSYEQAVRCIDSITTVLENDQLDSKISTMWRAIDYLEHNIERAEEERLLGDFAKDIRLVMDIKGMLLSSLVTLYQIYSKSGGYAFGLREYIKCSFKV